VLSRCVDRNQVIDPMAFWCRARDLGDLAHGCPRPAGARNVVRQALAGVGVEIDHAATHAIGLVEPDAILVVHADVPKRTGRTDRKGSGSPMRRSLRAFCALA